MAMGGISYCVFLPDFEGTGRNLVAMRDDPNLTPEQRRDKFRETFSNLSESERRQVFEGMMKEGSRKGNLEMSKFLKMSPAEQVATLKKQDEERKQRRQQGLPTVAAEAAAETVEAAGVVRVVAAMV